MGDHCCEKLSQYSARGGSGLFVTSLMPQRTVQAQSVPEPAIVLSLATLNDQLDDVAYLTEAAGFAQMGNMARMQAEGFLRGIDKSKPIGGLFYFDEGNPEPKPVFFVPVSNLDDLLDMVSQFAPVEDEDDYSVIQTPSGESLYIKDAGAYAVVAPKAELLENAPANIEEFVADLPGRYNIGARVFVQRIPEGMREQGLDMIESQYLEQLENMSADDDIAAELQMKNFEMQMKQIRSLVNETDELVLGLDFDREGKNIHFDVQMVGLDGSYLAKQSENYGDTGASRFAGFLDEAATFTVNGKGKLSAQDIEQYSTMLTDVRSAAMEKLEEEVDASDESFEQIKDLVASAFDILDSTLKDGVMDVGGNIVLSDDGANMALGVVCANPQEFEGKVKELVEVAKAEMEEEGVEVNMNVETFEGANFHEIVFPIPEDEEEMTNLFGDTGHLFIGFGSDTIYFAAGNDPMPNLKDSMTRTTGAETVPMQYNLYLAPLMQKIASIEGEDMVQQMADKLEANGRDRVRFLMKAMTNGLDMRFEVEDGILELIGLAAQQFGGMGPAVDF
ncbi:MAG: hypothetical protein R3C03_09285 [Pirellulaceae bacterium]